MHCATKACRPLVHIEVFAFPNVPPKIHFLALQVFVNLGGEASFAATGHSSASRIMCEACACATDVTLFVTFVFVLLLSTNPFHPRSLFSPSEI